MSFKLPYKIIPDWSDMTTYTIGYQNTLVQSEDATTITVTRDLGPDVWSANVITVLKSYFITVNIDGIDYDTYDLAEQDNAVLSWM